MILVMSLGEPIGDSTHGAAPQLMDGLSSGGGGGFGLAFNTLRRRVAANDWLIITGCSKVPKAQLVFRLGCFGWFLFGLGFACVPFPSKLGGWQQ